MLEVGAAQTAMSLLRLLPEGEAAAMGGLGLAVEGDLTELAAVPVLCSD